CFRSSCCCSSPSSAARCIWRSATFHQRSRPWKSMFPALACRPSSRPAGHWRLLVRSAGYAGFLLAALPAGALRAQASAAQPAEVGQPLQLTPSAPAAGEAPATPSEGEATPSSSSGTDSTERAPAGIEVNSLEAIGTDYGGLIEAGQGGFGIDMWR